jgi:outer membrane lipoprotein SlyB
MKTLTLIVLLLPIAGCAQYGGYRPTVDTRYPTQSYQRPYQGYQQQYQQPQYQQQYYQQPQQGYQQPYYQQQSYNQGSNYPLDEQECQRLAEESSSVGSQTLQGGVVGALGGAAAGAALGAIIGDPGKGAMLGSTAGIAGAGYGAYNADQQYKNAFRNCMRNRGYNVVN